MKNQLNTEFFEDLWLGGDHPSQLNADFWDLRAQEHNKSSIKNNSLISRENKVKDFLAKGLINDTSVVLDIGCGTGQLSIALAKSVKEVAALDFSENMLTYASENAKKARVKNIRFIQADWKEIEFEEPFDFVVSSMSPAINGPADLYKLMAVCKGHCYLSAFVERSSTLRETLYHLTDQTYLHQFHKINYIFNILWTKGFFPELSYEESCYNRLLALEQAKEIYPLELNIQNDPLKVKLIHGFLDQEAKDGFITEIVSQKKGELIWKCSHL
ncbi:class I SAM-dependent methyltransferase [Acetobacterium bakii]|uniref:Methyltransferase domain-containing protein n=1 Tax=Acetobacterium bakii TaxID=52689 RepID=A0A0L6TXI2_9FIRM|nr:class I SAM-dependent methyltransferase [Acetobacterium bakii]KNZ40958.1 hypothetical protein AKG39_14720 [Acetobacterium bakii]